MSYQVLARKWRPRNFNDMVGQAHVLRALVNALDQQRLHHAYLFTGTRGVGKTTLARILAKSLNCLDGVTSTPCGVCDACTAIDEGRFVDLIEVDAASRTKVEDTREILDNVQYAPTQGRYKVYLIDEVHMLSNHSFNALLKTLEEPPPHVKFLLATTDPQKLPATILSRCLQFNLTRMPLDLIEQHLENILQKEAVDYESQALRLLSQAADGSMRDALSLLDQALAYGQGQIKADDVASMLGYIDHGYILNLLTAVIQQQPETLMATIQQLGERVSDFATVLDALIATLHQLTVIKLVPNAMDNVAVDKEALNNLAEQSGAEDLQLFYQIAILGKRDLAYAPDSRTGFEMTLLRMLAFKPVDTVAAATPSSASAGQDKAVATVKSPAQQSSMSTVANTASTLPLNVENWPEIVKQLQINGAAAQLAANAAVDTVQMTEDKQQLSLSLSEEHAALSGYSSRLEDALKTYYQAPVKIVLNITGQINETPAVAERRENQQRLDAARSSIAQDSTIQALQDAFDARIIDETVQPNQ